APSVGQARQEIQNYCQERHDREQSRFSAELLECSLRHLDLVNRNANVYSWAKRNLPDSGWWPIPTDAGNARSLFTEFPYRHRNPLLDKKTPIVSAGSCFAIEIARHFQKLGYNYVVTEPQNAPDGSYREPEYSGDEHVNASAAWGIIF